MRIHIIMSINNIKPNFTLYSYIQSSINFFDQVTNIPMICNHIKKTLNNIKWHITHFPLTKKDTFLDMV